MKCYDWFFCTKKPDKDKVLGTILKSDLSKPDSGFILLHQRRQDAG